MADPTEWGAVLVESKDPTSWGAVPVAAQTAPPRSTMADIGAGAVSGLARGTTALAGTFGDIREGAAGLASKGAHALGYDVAPEKISGALRNVPGFKGPTSQAYTNTLENAVGKLPDAQTPIGQHVENVSSFLPAALSPEASGAGIVSRLVQNAVLPGVASELAGEFMKGTKYEQPARMGAAMMAGGMGSRREPLRPAPENDVIKAATSAGYDALNTQNLAPLPQVTRQVPTPMGALTGQTKTVTSSPINTMADDYRQFLDQKGLRPSNASGLYGALNELEKPSVVGRPPDVNDLVRFRSSLKNFFKNPDENSAGAAMLLPKVDAEIERHSPGTMDEIRKLDRDWSIVKAGEALDKRAYNAELNAAGEHSGLNLGNRLRQQLAGYLKSNESRFLKDQDRTDLEKAVRGTWTQNGLRLISNVLGGGGGLGSTALGLGVGASSSWLAGEDPRLGAAVAPLAGFGTRALANRASVRQFNRAAEAIRNRSNYAQSLPPQIFKPRLPDASRRALLQAIASQANEKNQ